MRSRWVQIALSVGLLLCASPGMAQDEPAVFLHGSFENQLNGMWLRLYNGGERVSLYNYTRLRVDLDADLWRDIQLRSDFVARLFVGETDFYLVNLIPKRTVDDLLLQNPAWSMLFEDKYRLDNELFVDNAYAKIPLGNFVFRVGKQPLEQGAGYLWNPTDVFTVKDYMDPTYEKPGVVALRTGITLGEIAALDLVVAPDGPAEHWTYGGRASLRLGSLSLSTVGYLTRVRESDPAGSLDDMVAAAERGQNPEKGLRSVDARRVLVGGDAVLDVVGIRWWVEGGYNFVEDKAGATEDWWELDSGLEYYFPSETHVMLEYFHYGRGPLQHNGFYDFNAWSGVLAMELKMLGRDFLYEGIDHPVADFWTLSFGSIQSLSDQSAVIMADVRWDFVQDGELWFMVSAAVGEAEDFMSSARGQAWLRLKLYF